MIRSIQRLLLVVALLSVSGIQGKAADEASPATPKQASDYDVVVIGGTPAGIAAAIASGRAGKTVLIVEQTPVLGGVLSSGVIRLDDLYVESNSGVMEEFRQRVRTYHRTELADDPLVQAHLKRDPRFPWNVAEGRAWEPHTSARIYAQMVAEVETITTRFNEVAVDVTLKGDRVTGVITQDRDNNGKLGAKHSYSGKVIIDATYEADLAEFAKVPFRIGREARSKEEPHAGRVYTNFFRSVPGAMKATILPESTGEADNRSQAFTYRLTGKDYGRPDHPYRLQEPPPNYDPAKYRWNRNEKPIIPNRKFDLLGISWGGDLTGYGTRWVLADWQERVEIEKIFRNYDLGWLYYIQTEGGSPNIGLPDDEFTDNNNLPYRLYVRQGRRIEGRYTLTESDVHKDLRGNGWRGPLNANSVAIGVYGIDAHNVQGPTVRDQPPYGKGAAEGTLHLFDVTGPYQIPYDVMVPKNHQGILFPVGISSTHVAMCTVRMEPVWSALGQAAGVAAALAIEHDIELHAVPVSQIQDTLVKQGCVLFFYTDLPRDEPGFEAVQKLSLLGAIADNPLERLRSNGPATSLSDLNKEDYRFRPNEFVTVGEFAQMVVKGFQIPLSITAAHFNDVPRGHAAFKYIETLYDYSSQSREPFFDYEVRKEPGSNTMILAQPEQKLSGARATKIIAGLLQKTVPALPKADANLTRSEAAQLIYQYLNNGRQLPGDEPDGASTSPHPDAVPNTHAAGDVDKPELVRFIVANPKTLKGTIVDEIDATLVGKWQYSTHTPPYVGIGYLHDQKDGKGTKSVTFTPDLPHAGKYEVRVSHCYNIRRSTNTPVLIHHADGETSVRINQQETPEFEKLFRSVGKFRFEAGKQGWVRISTDGTDGKYVIVDAVQFLPLSDSSADATAP